MAHIFTMNSMQIGMFASFDVQTWSPEIIFVVWLQYNLLVNTFMTSRLDYCNALLGGCPAYSINKLQVVQNAAARVLTRSRKYDHITPNFLVSALATY